MICSLSYIKPRTLYLDRITLSWFITFYVVGCDFALSESVTAVNLTSHNRIYIAEIIGYNSFRRNNNTLNAFIKNKQ